MRPLTTTCLPFLFLLAACNGDDDTDVSDTDEPADTDPNGDTDDTDVEELEIRGTWDDSWGGSHTIDETTWVSGSSVFHVTSYDNEADVLIAENDAANEWNGGLWSRYDWTWSGTQLYYCQTAYGAASEAEAEGTPRADDTDLAAGCGGFGWTELTAPAE
jgi:hypothetical protein